MLFHEIRHRVGVASTVMLASEPTITRSAYMGEADGVSSKKLNPDENVWSASSSRPKEMDPLVPTQMES